MFLFNLCLLVRYIDDIFMTTNQPVDNITAELQRAVNKDPNIVINYRMNKTVDFLDVNIMNQRGQLRTTVYHKPAAEPYILPYTSDHPRHIHRNIPYAALLRAIRIISHLDDFISERIHIEVSLLLNSYPPHFIRKQFDRLLSSPMIRSESGVLNKMGYQRMHQILLRQPTRRENLLNKSTVDPVESPMVLQPKKWNSKVVYPRYFFDGQRSTELKKQFLDWWKEYYAFAGSSVHDVKVRLVAQTGRTLEHSLIHKKPPKDMLVKMESTTRIEQ